MKAGTQGWKQTLQHALVITIGLYLATFPAPMRALQRSESQAAPIGKFPANKIYLIQSASP